MATEPEMLQEEKIRQAADILKQGGLVAFPTETVYGLGADAENAAALKRLYTVKGRPEKHPVIVHLPEAGMLSQWAREIPDAAFRLAEAFWPGPMTLILKRDPRVPDAVTGGQDTVGLRVPNHPVALKLLQAFGGGVAAPSANRFGRLSPTCAAHVQADLGDAADYILDGGVCPVGVESTIVAFREGRPIILRPGHITRLQVMAITEGIDLLPTSLDTVSVAPGTLSRHYAPRTPLAILLPEEIDVVLAGLSGTGKRIGVLARRSCPEALYGAADLLWKQAPELPEDYARSLYAVLRELDEMALEQLIVEAVPPDESWQAVSDRLSRAACAT